MTSQSNLIPFGKYKDQPIEVLRNDPGYVSWLSTQSWVVERYPQIHTLIINNFTEPSETPEHNAMQVRFLDNSFTTRLWDLLRPDSYYVTGPCLTSKLHEHSSELKRNYDELPTYKYSAPPASSIDCIFEHDAIDVTMIVTYKYPLMIITPRIGDYILPDGKIVPGSISRMTDEIREVLNVREYDNGWSALYACPQQNSYTEIEWSTRSTHERFIIELKPSLGDDYPAILRQVNSIATDPLNQYRGHKLLIFNTFTATGATLPQVSEIFRRSGITLIEMSVIDQSSDNYYIII